MRRQIFLGISVGVIVVVMLFTVYFLRGRTPRIVSHPPPRVLMEEGKTALAAGRLLEAKEKLRNALEDLEDPRTIAELKKTLEDINTKIIFSPLLDECSTEYMVKPNDALIKIAKQFTTTVALIKRGNGLESDVIWPGQKLKVNVCPFSIVVDKSQNVLFLNRGEEVIKTYLVATGKNNSTPIGSFKIINRLVRPTWFKIGAVIPPDSPDNILGSRWLGLDIEGYGIHGTTEPDNLGVHVTLGCIRMSNHDVEELYDIVPIGTEVTIVD